MILPWSHFLLIRVRFFEIQRERGGEFVRLRETGKLICACVAGVLPNLVHARSNSPLHEPSGVISSSVVGLGGISPHPVGFEVVTNRARGDQLVNLLSTWRALRTKDP